jgi:hypothetical protein
LKKKMYSRLILSSIVLAALAANPCFAKDGHPNSHAQHGARPSAAKNGTSGKETSGNGSGNRASSATPAPSKADAPINAEAAVAPPVLPPRGLTQQQIRITNPSGKTANAGPSSRGQVGATAMPAPTARNAIGQPVIPPKNNITGLQPPLPVPQRSGAVSPPILHGAPAAAPAVVSSGAARVNAVNNGGGVNGATVIRPANAALGIGGPAQPRYGINGTTVQNKH